MKETVVSEDMLPSSSCADNEKLLQGWLESPTSMESVTKDTGCSHDLFRAKRRAASVNIADAAENLFEIRRMIGFSWDQLASLLGVEPRTLVHQYLPALWHAQ